MKTKSSKPKESCIWDPGCIPVGYNNNNNNNMHSISLAVITREDMNHTKDQVPNKKRLVTRISPQRSEDSGYSDSSDSVPSYYKGSVHTVPYITTVYISPCHTRLHSSEHLTTNTRHTDTQHRWMNNETSDTKNMILEEKLVAKSNNTTNTRMNSITVLLE